MKKKYLFRKQFMIALLLLSGIACLSAQNITYSFANAQMTNDGSSDFYEVDVMISTDTDFKYGTAVIFIDYNTAAFGTNIASSGGTPNSTLQLPHPSGDASTGYIMDERYVNVINVYGTISQFNSEPGKVALTFNQAQQASFISNNVTTGAPKLLCHIKIPYTDTTKDPMVTFDAVNSNDTSYTAQSIVSPPAADGTQLTNDTYVSTGSVIPNTWSGGSTGDWHTGGNWSMGVPTTTSDITIPAGSVIAASTQVDVNTMIIPNNAALNATANVNNQGTITIRSVAANSGVLIAPSLNTNTVTYERGGFTANTWSLVSAPVSGQKIKDFVENPANGIRINTSVTPNRYAVAYYDDSRAVGSKWVYYDVDFLAANPNTEFEIGRSYSMSRATDGVVTFTGAISTANASATVTASQFNAIGNPFTAFVSATNGSGGGTANFINDNLANFDPTNAAVYVWDAAQSRYLPRSLADADATSLPPGKGFFIRTNTGVSSMTFNIDKRTTQPATGNTSFNRNNANTPSIQLKATLNDLTIDTNIKYFDHATQGLDPGYDVAIFGGNDFDIYTKLLEGHQDLDFAIQSLPTNEYENMVIPVGLKASAGDQITFAIDALQFPPSINVYLEDREQNTFELLETDSQTYQVTLSEDINGIGRFYVHTTSSVLSTGNPLELQGVNVFTTGQRNLRITGVDNEQGTVKLYNILGAQVFKNSFTGTGSNNFTLPYLKTGIYIINLETEKGRLNKKIVIE